MKTAVHLSLFVLANTALSAYGQGTTFIYDQQSANENSDGGTSIPIQSFQPMGQSFTPTLTSINFVRLKPSDGNYGNGQGATLIVNLRAKSITGTILSSTAPVTMPDSYYGPTDFYFPTSVSLTPGTMYFFQPVIQSGDTSWNIGHYHYNYSGGTEFRQGAAYGGFHLWFREGLAVPEPSAAWLTFFGLTTIFVLRRKNLGIIF